VNGNTSQARACLAIVALAAAVLAAGASSSSAAPRTCRPVGAKAVIASTEGVVYRVGRRRDTTRFVACRTRRSRPLALGGADCFNAEAPSQFVMARRWLGFVSSSCDTVSGTDTIVVVDLRSRKRRVAATASRTPAARDDPYAQATQIALARSGEIAWIVSFVTGGTRTYEVRRSNPALRTESVLLDAGPEVAADSLAAGANLFYWTRGGTARSAPLR
jgi:hypothetical protein